MTFFREHGLIVVTHNVSAVVGFSKLSIHTFTVSQWNEENLNRLLEVVDGRGDVVHSGGSHQKRYT